VSIILYHERFCTAQCYNFHSEDEVQLDLLEKPLTSYEIQKLAYLLTKLSQLLNHVLGLPSARQTVTWSWQTVWDHLVGAADESQGARQGERGARVGMLGWFRFNLRIFASHTDQAYPTPVEHRGSRQPNKHPHLLYTGEEP
jgi:hypothetical protein